MAKKELITACRATFKNGDTKEYNTIEEASEDTGLSVASIKIRCNKKGCKGKDGTLFEWTDEHTKKSFQAKKSKNKGSAWEYEVVKCLKDIGYEGCKTAKGESKNMDNNKIDIVDASLPVNIQCKYTQNLPNYFDIRDACTDKDKPYCLIWKKAGKNGEQSRGTVAVIPIEYFYQLIEK